VADDVLSNAVHHRSGPAGSSATVIAAAIAVGLVPRAAGLVGRPRATAALLAVSAGIATRQFAAATG